VDTRTVIRYVSRLGLVSHWERRKLPSIEFQVPEVPVQLPISTKQREYWLRLQAQYPDATKTMLRKISPATYAWLYRHDRAWLDHNSPALQQPTVTNDRVDWVQRDLEVLDRVKLAVDEILKAEKPQRLTISRIGKAIGQLALLEQHLELMSATKAYLTGAVESIEDFQIRRIRWAIDELDRQREPVVSWRVMRLAGLGGNISDRVKWLLEREIE
jgi:hypothetical protein